MIFGICRGCGNPNDDFNKCQSCEDWINEKTRVLQALKDLIAQREYKIKLSKSDKKSECDEFLEMGAKNNQEHPDFEHFATQDRDKEQRIYTKKSSAIQTTLSSKEFTQAQEQKQIHCGF
ncbi:34986_t:CDS:2, partial [Racocetra persica]